MFTTSVVRRAWFVVCLLLAACGGSNNSNGDGGVDAPGTLPDDGPCVPDSLRCNGNSAQKCNAEGTRWETTEVCATFCQDGLCALDGLDVASDMELDGAILVAGAVTVRSGATLSSPTGNLTITADSITVESGGSISVAATGLSPDGQGNDAFSFSAQPGGGGYGSLRIWGSDTDSDVQPGSPGGKQFQSDSPALGGGVVRLLAKSTIVIAGQITANGTNGGTNTQCFVGGGGASGGGVLVAGDDVTVTGSISTAGGLGGPSQSGCGVTAFGGAGGVGRVKILFGSTHEVTGTLVGTLTQGLLPPVPLKSISHVDQNRIYNDGFLSLDVNWNKAFPSLQGYYVRLDTSPSGPPSAGNGMFLTTEQVSFQSSAVSDGDNYVHVASVDALSAIGTIETVFHVAINTRGPSLSSSSHPSPTVFSDNTSPFFSWSFPQGDMNVSGTHYVLDSFGDTVPTAADTQLPAGQKQLQLSGIAAGVHMLHVVSIDNAGRLTKAAGHYRINVGTDPGVGAISGQVVDAASVPVIGATVTLNRGLIPGSSTSTGGMYSITGIPAGTWELTVKLGARTATKSITVAKDGTASGNVTLP